MADLRYTAFDETGKPCGTADIFLPVQLDWMPIALKALWFRWLANGPAATRYVLLMSQGEQQLLADVTLSPLDYKTHKEKIDGSSDKIEEFIQEGGYSRVPRNQ